MQELDFSAQIKAANFNFAPKTPKFGDFKLSEKAENFLQSIASDSNKEILASVAKNGLDASKNFHRLGVSDVEMAVARVCRYAKHGDAKMLTADYVDLSDLEYALAKVVVAQNKLQTSDFLSLAEEEEEDEEDENECECEDSETEEVDGKIVCSKCKKSAKAKKKC